MQLTILTYKYLVYFVLKETDIHLKGQERKLVYTAKKLNYKTVYPLALHYYFKDKFEGK